MTQPMPIENEEERLSDLEELQLLESAPEQSFDNITNLAAYICKVPIAFISLVGRDKQWFKSKLGTHICETDREISFCAHAILRPGEIMEVEDARLDPRFEDNPLTKGDMPIIFYAGIPLHSAKGNPVGTLCVVDSKPKKLTKKQKIALLSLGKQVETLFELRRQNGILIRTENKLNEKNNQLKKFAGTVSHDMKMPLANMIVTSDILKMKYADQFDQKGIEYLSYLKKSSFRLSDYINKLLNYYESDNLKQDQLEEFELNHLLEEIIDLLNIDHDCEIHLPEKEITLHTNKGAVHQILLNLITNSLKYNDKDRPVITFNSSYNADFYNIQITDNGVGIAPDKQNEIFELFKTADTMDKNGKKGHGIGLSTVYNLVKNLGGQIHVNSTLGEGTSFDLSIKNRLPA